jgi:hypothetical protein
MRDRIEDRDSSHVAILSSADCTRSAACCSATAAVVAAIATLASAASMAW